VRALVAACGMDSGGATVCGACSSIAKPH
jgi:hypothetical protein